MFGEFYTVDQSKLWTWVWAFGWLGGCPESPNFCRPPLWMVPCQSLGSDAVPELEVAIGVQISLHLQIGVDVHEGAVPLSQRLPLRVRPARPREGGPHPPEVPRGGLILLGVVGDWQHLEND